LHNKEKFYYEVTIFLNNLQLPFVVNPDPNNLEKLVYTYNKKFKKRKRDGNDRDGRKRKKSRKNDSDDSSVEVKRKRIKWTDEESKALEEGISKFGMGNWAKILENYRPHFHKNRRTRDLRVKWRYISKKLNQNQENNKEDIENENQTQDSLVSQSQENTQTQENINSQNPDNIHQNGDYLMVESSDIINSQNLDLSDDLKENQKQEHHLDLNSQEISFPYTDT